MRKLRDLAAPDDPEAWSDVSGMWPTRRSSYESADISTAASAGTGTSPLSVFYGFAFGKTTAGVIQEYVGIADGVHGQAIYGWNGTTLTKRYNETTFATGQRGSVSMVQFGAVAILATGLAGIKIQAAATFTTNFADAGASAPTLKNILVVQSSAILAFSSDGNGWAASDVGDYTNWSTGESASGTIYSQPGNVGAAVAYGNDAYVFKPGSIHRMTYVGGTVKWQVQTAWIGLGVPDRKYLSVINQATQDWAVATAHGIAFYGGNGLVYLFDGASPPRCLNPETTVNVEGFRGVFIYDPTEDRLCIAPGMGSSASGTAASEAGAGATSSFYIYYSFPADAWGYGNGSNDEIYSIASIGPPDASGPVRGGYSQRNELSSKPAYWIVTPGVTGAVTRCAPADAAVGGGITPTVCYVKTAKMGRSDGKTTFSRVIPQLRRRTDTGGPNVNSLTFELFPERDADVAATSTRTISESTDRRRFDLLGGASTDTFGRFKLTWNAYDVEIDDFIIKSKFVLEGD